jgi:hypothetical protein
MVRVAVRDDDRRTGQRLGPQDVRERHVDVAPHVLFLAAIDEDDLAVGRLDDGAVPLTDIDEPHLEERLIPEARL